MVESPVFCINHNSMVMMEPFSLFKFQEFDIFDLNKTKRMCLFMTDLSKEYDLIVAGGGLSGAFAAVAASREGLKTLVIERYGFIGGMATAGVVNPFMSFSTTDENGTPVTVNNAGLFKQLLERLDNVGGLNGRTFNEELLKILLERMVLEHSVDILYHAFVFGVERDKDTIKSLKVATKKGELKLKAKYYVDATGDADLCFHAGCGYSIGREADGLCQPMTTCFRLSNVKHDTDDRATINEKYNKFQEKGEITNPRENVLMFPHVDKNLRHFNSTRIIRKSGVDPVEMTDAEIEGRRQVLELYGFMKGNIKGFEESNLVQIAPQVGVRESRRIEGEYTLTEDDLVNCVKFEDSIARGCYSIDVHNPAGTGTVIKKIKRGDYYTIPLRSLMPKGVSNLIVAGRPISSTHTAHSAIRIMPICSNIGEAAGCTVAIAFKRKVPVKGVGADVVRGLLDRYGAVY